MKPLVALAVALTLAACQPGDQPHEAGKGPLRAVATTTMIADLVRQIGGHRVAVKGIMAPGGDPHVYKPVPDDAQAVSQAQVVFINGLKLEHWIEDLIHNAGGEHAVVTVTDGVKARKSPFDANVPDPHFWFDVARFKLAAANVAKALAQADPAGKAAYAANLALLEPNAAIAQQAGCTPAQLALAWLLAKADHIVPIPGTVNPAHLTENLGAAAVALPPG